MTPIISVFAAKVVVSIGLSIMAVLLIRFRAQVLPVVQDRAPQVLGACFLFFRFIPFIIVYLILNEVPRNDVPFFYEKATKALQGGLVYRDYWSFHAPLFSYLIAIPLLIWHSPKAIVLLMVMTEAFTVWLTYRHYRRQNPEAGLLAVLYFMLPAPLVICLLGGQEDIGLWLFGLLTMVAAARRKEPGLAIGLWMAAALLTLKVTFVMIAFPVFFLLGGKTRLRWMGALALVGIPTLLLLYAVMGTQFMMPVQHGDIPFAPNLTTVLKPFLGTLFSHVPLKTLNWIGVAATVTILATVGLRYRKLPYAAVFPSIWVMTFGLFMLFQPSAMAYYIFLFLIAAVFELTPARPGARLWLLIVANLVVVVQPFYWIYLDQIFFNSFADFNSPLKIFEYVLEVITVGCVAAYVWLAWKRLELLRNQKPVKATPVAA